MHSSRSSTLAEVVRHVVLGDHEYERVEDSTGVLERQIQKYKAAGRRLLSYWRAGRSWMFKLELGARVRLTSENAE
jgi:hypothetical protein